MSYFSQSIPFEGSLSLFAPYDGLRYTQLFLHTMTT